MTLFFCNDNVISVRPAFHPPMTPPETLNLNEVKVFRISDLIGTTTVSDTEDPYYADGSGPMKRKRGRYIGGKKPAYKEASAFKISNKLAVHGNKPKKERKSLTNGTDILWHHDQKLKYFAKLYQQLPAKRKELEACTSPWKRRNLEAEIQSIEHRDEEMKYMMLTQDLIAEYTRLSQSDSSEGLIRDTSGNITKYIGKYDNVEKDRLTEEYCRLVNNGLMIDTKKLIFDSTKCESCGADTRLSEGFVSCTECGTVAENSVQDFQFSYRDMVEQTQKNAFSYKRENRFQEILSTLQAKENTEIPPYVMNAVQQEINKELEPDLKSLNTVKIRYYLKKLSLTNFYEHAPHILNKITGQKPIHIPHEVEAKWREMFRMIQEPFEIVKSEVCPKRISFLSYHFVLHKFAQLLSLHEYQHCFTLLKSNEKLKLQDRIWRGITGLLNWKYIPSTG